MFQVDAVGCQNGVGGCALNISLKEGKNNLSEFPVLSLHLFLHFTYIRGLEF